MRCIWKNGPSSGSRPSHDMPSRMTSPASCDARSMSVSSMRRMNWPPVERANAHGYSAERMLPRWMKPVGDGAKRVRVVMWLRFSQQWRLFLFDARARDDLLTLRRFGRLELAQVLERVVLCFVFVFC